MTQAFLEPIVLGPANAKYIRKAFSKASLAKLKQYEETVHNPNRRSSVQPVTAQSKPNEQPNRV